MGDEASKPEEKSLEMRVAELEDKLSKIHITEDELKAYHKVNALLGGGGIAASPKETAIAAPGVSSCTGCINECGVVRNWPIVRQCTIIRPIVIRACTYECFECGPGLPGGGGIGGIGSQFGGLGG